MRYTASLIKELEEHARKLIRLNVGSVSEVGTWLRDGDVRDHATREVDLSEVALVLRLLANAGRFESADEFVYGIEDDYS
jgi:hypothetical protein